MKNKILIINDGTPTPFNETINSFIVNGFTVYLLINKNNISKVKHSNINIYTYKGYFLPNVSVNGLKQITNLINSFLSFVQLLFYSIKYLNQISPDIIYGNRPVGALCSLILGKFLKKIVVTRYYGIINAYDDLIKKRYIQFLKNWQLYISFKLKGDLYIITDDGTFGDKFANKFNIPKTNTLFLKNGVNKLLNKHRKDSKNSITILSYSRLSILKRVDRFVTLVHKLKDLENVNFLIAGDGEEQHRLKMQAAKLNISDRITFLGNIPHSNISNLFNKADILVALSDFSNVSNTVYEAMTYGLAVVCTNSGNTSDIIKHKKNGILTPNTDDSKELEEAIKNLVNNKKEVKKLGDSAKEYIDNNFYSWKERTQIEIDKIKLIAANK